MAVCACTGQAGKGSAGGKDDRICSVREGSVCTRLASLPLKLILHLKRSQVGG